MTKKSSRSTQSFNPKRRVLLQGAGLASAGAVAGFMGALGLQPRLRRRFGQADPHRHHI